ncbi:hypothetical protein BGZ95_003409 [Linnemannia exigua]|uniref:F-box domain-containing protein n=1 Tax=Linnemannia exigua TaxID=604196 RepID=A0AAD4DK68_9FUNG|nr:hypothetical protein BGZ95_003409 [Linnemannia exigua]
MSSFTTAMDNNTHKMHPLLLPELLGLIADYLPVNEKRRCLQVCCTWHSFFSPQVWKSCTIDYERHSKLHSIPTRSIATYGSHIRTLTFQGFITVDHFAVASSSCIRLEHLKVVDGAREGFEGFSNNSPQMDQVWDSLTLLLTNNPHLTTIEISEMHDTPSIFFWDAIAVHSGIKSLSLDQVRVEQRFLYHFWKACSGLERLTLQRCRIWDSNREFTHYQPVMFRRLQELSIENLFQPLPHVQIELLRLAPQLCSFYWRGGRIHGLARDTLLNILGSGRLPNLDSIDIMGMNIVDLDTEHIVQCMSRVRKLALYQTNVGPSGLRALQPHFKTVEELNLMQCPLVTSSDVALILRSCPVLHIFKAETIVSDDIKDGEVWPCHEHLHTLSLYFHLTKGDTIADNQRTFVLLSKLKALRRLNISRYMSPHERTFNIAISLQLRFDHGLAHLASLRHLEELYFDRLAQDMTMDDAKWMEHNWKALRVIRGVFNNRHATLSKEISTFFANTFSGHVPLPPH